MQVLIHDQQGDSACDWNRFAMSPRPFLPPHNDGADGVRKGRGEGLYIGMRTEEKKVEAWVMDLSGKSVWVVRIGTI